MLAISIILMIIGGVFMFFGAYSAVNFETIFGTSSVYIGVPSSGYFIVFAGCLLAAVGFILLMISIVRRKK